MKKPWTLLAAPLVMCAVSNNAFAGLDCCFTPYVGADAQIRHMEFKRNLGGNALKKNYPQGNFFAGLKLNECVGVELGYTIAGKKSRTVKHNNSDIVFGLPLEQPTPLVPAINSVTHNASKVDGWNLNLVGFYPILCEDNSLQLIGSIGVTQLKIRTKNITEATFVSSTVVTETDHIHFKKRKAVLRLSGGVQNMLTDCIGIRALVTWENSAKLSVHGKDINTAQVTRFIAKPENSFSYGLGVFTVF